jgi:hypothetical protein
LYPFCTRFRHRLNLKKTKQKRRFSFSKKGTSRAKLTTLPTPHPANISTIAAVIRQCNVTYPVWGRTTHREPLTDLPGLVISTKHTSRRIHHGAYITAHTSRPTPHARPNLATSANTPPHSSNLNRPELNTAFYLYPLFSLDMNLYKLRVSRFYGIASTPLFYIFITFSKFIV